MLPDYRRYYGCVLGRLIDHCATSLKIRRLNHGVQGFYLVEDKMPIYIKFSRSRRGPWTFNFHHEHQLQYSKLVSTYGDCITAFVCGKDGIAALSHVQLREILDDQFDQQESVSIRRKLKRMYSVNGTNGKLSQKVSRDSLLTLASQMLGDVFADSNSWADEDDESGDEVSAELDLELVKSE